MKLEYKKKPKILERKKIASSKLFKIESCQIVFSNGNERLYECISPINNYQKAVLIVPFLDNETLILIKEYSVGIEDYTLSFPKGSVDPGEDIFESANRELMEEAGYSSDNYEYLRDLYLSPNYMKQHISIVAAKNLKKKKIKGDEPEDLEVFPWKLSKIENLINHPNFIECRSFAALMLIWKKFLLLKK